MPSRRELIGNETPFDGLHCAEFQWKRLAAFVLGVGFLVWIRPPRYLPDRVAASLVAIPIGLLFYGVSDQSWRASLRVTIGVGIGLALGTQFDIFSALP